MLERTTIQDRREQRQWDHSPTYQDGGGDRCTRSAGLRWPFRGSRFTDRHHLCPTGAPVRVAGVRAIAFHLNANPTPTVTVRACEHRPWLVAPHRFTPSWHAREWSWSICSSTSPTLIPVMSDLRRANSVPLRTPEHLLSRSEPTVLVRW